MTSDKDWADVKADAVVNSIGYAKPEAEIAAGMRDLAEECAKIAEAEAVGDRGKFKSLGAWRVAQAIRARFPRCSDGE